MDALLLALTLLVFSYAAGRACPDLAASSVLGGGLSSEGVNDV